jgi:dTDP-4-amino-4,6-dideoxygalactose transaminase
MKKIQFLSPKFPDVSEVTEDIKRIYESNMYTNSGPFEKQLTRDLEEYLSQNIKVSINCNATIGLMMAVRHLFIKGRKKVLIQSFTFAAGVHAILWSDYQPVFVDINQDDWQMDIVEAENYIKNNVDDLAGVIVCNTFGTPNNGMEAWESLCKKYELPLIVDSAAGMGSVYKNGEKIGGMGDCEVFSFHATKPFGIGEGGAITSKNEKLINDFEIMKNFSFGSERTVEFLGLNAKVPEITCAIGIRVLKKFDQRLKKRRELLGIYKELLMPKGVIFHENDELSTVAYVSILVNENRDELLKKYAETEIVVRNYYNPPLHKHAFFKDFEKASDLKKTEALCSKIVSLPMYEELTREDIERICSIIK